MQFHRTKIYLVGGAEGNMLASSRDVKLVWFYSRMVVMVVPLLGGGGGRHQNDTVGTERA
jgi:hypothetical protein